MKSKGERATKTTASPIAKLKPASRKAAKTVRAKRPVRKAASTSGRMRQRSKSSLPAQFRPLKQLSLAKDPRFWTLRKEFKDYFRQLPEEEKEPFLDGLGSDYLGYLLMELIHEESNAPRIFWED
jgi:hypothetical protein